MKTESPMRVRNWDALYENNRTRILKRMEWVPIPNSLAGDGYTELVDHPNAAAHLGAWLAIVQVASLCKPRGVLLRSNGQPHDAASLARITRLPVDVFYEVLPRLLSIGWLELDTPEISSTVPESGSIMPESGSTLQGTDYRREWKGMEGNGKTLCASGDAWMADSPHIPSINEPAFSTTEVDAAFPVEKPPDAPRNEKRRLSAQQEAWFQEWWAAYWLKKSRKRACEAFRRHVRTEARFRQVMDATRAQTPEMLSREPHHRPHGATWLNGERWEDDTAPEAPTADNAVARILEEQFQRKENL